MSCLEMPRSPVPEVFGEQRRAFNDAETMQPRARLRRCRPRRATAGREAQDVRPDGVYRPNYNFLTPNMRSPDYVQMSTAAAISLGIMGGNMHRTGCTRCLNLLLTYPEGCRANCAYCGLARHREAERDYADRNFIRVDGRRCPMARSSTSSPRAATAAAFTACASDDHPSAFRCGYAVVLRKWVDHIKHVPVSILSNPTTMTRLDVHELKDFGADIFTVALDAGNPKCSSARAATACSRRTAGTNTGRSFMPRPIFLGRNGSALILSSGWARATRTCLPRCRRFATSAATATCSRSSPSAGR